MSGNIGGQDGNQLNITLYNGKTVNLKKLDKLIGKSTMGSVFAKFDTAEKGGNANNIFDEAEITQIKNLLLQYQASDNSVSQDELNQMFGYGQIGPDLKQKNFDVNKLTSLLDSIPDDVPQEQQTVKDTPPPTEENQVFTKYTVQPGDTPEVIAKKLGFTGEEAKSYAKKLREHLKANNQLDKRGWLKVGQHIELLGDHTETLKNSTEYTEDIDVLEQRYAQTEHAQKAIQREVARKVNIPDAVTKRAQSITKNGGKCSIVQNSDGGFSIIQTSGGNYMKNHKIGSIELKYDKDGNMISQINNMLDGSVVEGKWANGKMNWKTIQKAPVIKAPAGKKAAENMSNEEKARMLMPSEWGYPEKLQDKIINLRLQGIECKVTETRNGFKMALDEDRMNYLHPNWERMMTPEFFRDKKSLILDKEGNIVQQNQTYNDRRVITRYENGKPVYTETQYKQRVKYKKVDEQRTVSGKVAADIDIHRPEHLNEDGTRFADSLEKNKAALMKTLGLSNEQYNNLANLAMGIAEQETHFGASSYTTRSGETSTQWRNLAKQTMDAVYYNEALPDFVKDTVFALGGAVSSSVDEYYQKYTDGTKSYGMTQVKVDEFIKDNPVLKKQLAAFGINSGEDIRKSPEKQAIATMIILNNKRIVAQSQEWQTRLANNNANISDKDQQITQNDLIALLYNGNSAKTNLLKEGKLTINDAPYARNVRSYTNYYYKVSEDQASRHRADSLGAESQGNNGRLGTVIFMPGAYTTDVKNSKEDIQTLEEALNKNTSIPQQLKDQLIMAVRKNEIAFGYGLKPEEAASITASDAQLMLDKLGGLKDKISNLVDPARIRKEAQATQADFRSDYLQSRQVLVNDSDVPAGSIIPALSSGDIVDERLEYNRETVVTRAHRAEHEGGAQRAIARANNSIAAGNYRGFAAQEDLGVNPYDANGDYLPTAQRELAEYASDVAKDMGTSGLCLTGFKAAFESAGIAERGEVVYPKGHKDWGKPIENAKDLRYYLDAHPEKFEEVKYVSLGNGTSRELNASDIKNLPAGYIGVFIPGPGYEDQAGHAFITNGNGQGYADEVDNLRWDDFKAAGAGNGKGEHGTFKIYRLKV